MKQSFNQLPLIKHRRETKVMQQAINTVQVYLFIIIISFTVQV